MWNYQGIWGVCEAKELALSIERPSNKLLNNLFFNAEN
jgi:hypothetical protein